MQAVAQYFQMVFDMVPAMFIVVGLVTFIGQFGVKGKWLMGVSMALGVAAGAVTVIIQNGGFLPTNFVDWVIVAASGVSLGLVTSLFHDELKVVAEKAIKSYIQAREAEANAMVEGGRDEPQG